LKSGKDSKTGLPENQRDKNHSFKDRLHWAFSKKQSAQELVDELEKCKTTLSVTFNIDLVYFRLI